MPDIIGTGLTTWLGNNIYYVIVITQDEYNILVVKQIRSEAEDEC